MANAVAFLDTAATRHQGMESLDASDEYNEPRTERYWPTELLGTFTLLMASHGRCVSSAMMLGDREYALWQLARAHTMDDDKLREVAVHLFTYFDDPATQARSAVYHS